MKKVWDYDIIFISYDEPNADENWNDLNSKVGHAKRVHGVKGIDASHKRAGELSYSDRFFVVDGDTKVDKQFFALDVDEDKLDDNYVYSWAAKNDINGLVYGNGGIKFWPKHVMKKMISHEGDENGGTDFCWTVPYYQMTDWFSVSHCGTTSVQAFRTGFREGVRLTFDASGNPVSDIKELWTGNITKLLTWMNVGSDAQFGLYAMMGARLGCYLTLNKNYNFIKNFNPTQINDYDWFDLLESKIADPKLWYHDLGNRLHGEFSLDVVNFDPVQSRYIKRVLSNPPRTGLMFPNLAEDDYLIKNNLVK